MANLGDTPLQDRGDAAAIIEAMDTLHGAEEFTVGNPDDGQGTILVVPKGMAVHDIKKLVDAYRIRPERLKGVASMADADSMIEFVKRHHRAGETVVFANQTASSITAIMDWHGEDGGKGQTPGWAEHRALYQMLPHKDWVAWSNFANAERDQQAFAEFMQDRSGDIIPPDLLNHEDEATRGAAEWFTLNELTAASPSEMINVSRGLSLRVNRGVTNAVTLETGATQLQFSESIDATDKAGGVMRVPGAFAIGIRVYQGDTGGFAIPVRVRYRVDGSKVKWRLILNRPDEVLETVFRERVQSISDALKEYGIPTYFGTP